jgi:hypothetical protein
MPTPATELVRLALIFAIQDREGYAHADPGPAGDEAAALAKELRAYHKRRFGGPLTELERMLEGATKVGLHELRALKGQPHD